MVGLEARQPAVGAPVSSGAHRDVVKRYCASCHNDRLKTGGFTLDAVAAAEVGQNPEAWEKVVRKMRARQMPPVGLPRPDEATYQATIESLEQSLDRAALAHPNPGRTDTLRRMNRTEYRNAIRDLLALDVDVAALLPADESSYGFDNVTVGICRRHRSIDTLRPRRRSAGWRSDVRAALPAAIRSGLRRTSRRRSTSRAFPSARVAAPLSRIRSRSTASTRSRFGSRAIATSMSKA